MCDSKFAVHKKNSSWSRVTFPVGKSFNYSNSINNNNNNNYYYYYYYYQNHTYATTHAQPHMLTTTHSALRNKQTVWLAWLTDSRRTKDTGMNDLPSEFEEAPDDGKRRPLAFPMFHQYMTEHRWRCNNNNNNNNKLLIIIIIIIITTIIMIIIVITIIEMLFWICTSAS